MLIKGKEGRDHSRCPFGATSFSQGSLLLVLTERERDGKEREPGNEAAFGEVSVLLGCLVRETRRQLNA